MESGEPTPADDSCPRLPRILHSATDKTLVARLPAFATPTVVLGPNDATLVVQLGPPGARDPGVVFLPRPRRTTRPPFWCPVLRRGASRRL